jgi:hypothetical protein
VYEKKLQIGEGMALTSQLLGANNKGPLWQANESFQANTTKLLRF